MSESRIAVLEASHQHILDRFADLNSQLSRMAAGIEKLAIVAERQEHFDADMRSLKAEFAERKAITDPIIMDAEKVKSEVLTTIRLTGMVLGVLQVVVLSFCGWVVSEIGDIRKTQYSLTEKVAQVSK